MKNSKENKIRCLCATAPTLTDQGTSLKARLPRLTVLANLKGRVIVGTFALILSVFNLITIAEKYGRKVVLKGRSIHTYVEVAHEPAL